MKYMTCQKMLALARENIVYGLLCSDCDVYLRNVRTRLSWRVGSDHKLLNFASCDLNNVTRLVSYLEVAKQSNNDHTVCCTYCSAKGATPAKSEKKRLSVKKLKHREKVLKVVQNS